MKLWYTAIIAVLCIACTQVPKQSQNSLDPVIGGKDITNEMAGSAYRSRATAYFIINNTDTSGFMPIFSESKSDSTIALDLNLPCRKPDLSYSQKLTELEYILQKASDDYKLELLRSVFIGRLVLTGDLAIELTNEYIKTFGEAYSISTANYPEISKFLNNSKLSKDFNSLLEPYQLRVSEVSIEKAFFTSNDELLRYSEVEADSAGIPDQILDCITWVGIKEK